MKAVNGDRRSTANGSRDLPTTYTHLRSKWRLGWRRGGAASERALGACAAEETPRASCTRWIVGSRSTDVAPLEAACGRRTNLSV